MSPFLLAVESFIADTGVTHTPGGPAHIRKHKVKADGTLGLGGASAAKGCLTGSAWIVMAGSGPRLRTASIVWTRTVS